MLVCFDRFFQQRLKGKLLSTVLGVYLTPGGNFGNDIRHRLCSLGLSWANAGDLFDEWAFSPGLSNYGVADDVGQVLAYYSRQVADPERWFVIGMMPVRKADQPPDRGWRWHKWGEYIGNHDITQEYLYDEPVVEQIYCFHIVELLDHAFWAQYVAE